VRRAPNSDTVDGSLLFACRVKSGEKLLTGMGFLQLQEARSDTL
jgi:hypothetical protein